MQRAIGSMVGVSQKSVSRIMRQHAETGSVVPRSKGKCGRKRKSTPKNEAIVLRNRKRFHERVVLNCRKIQHILEYMWALLQWVADWKKLVEKLNN